MLTKKGCFSWFVKALAQETVSVFHIKEDSCSPITFKGASLLFQSLATVLPWIQQQTSLQTPQHTFPCLHSVSTGGQGVCEITAEPTLLSAHLQQRSDIRMTEI